MVERQQVTSLDLLSHPGETLQEIIEDRNITQKELAIRTGFSEKHISTVLNCQKSISAVFARRLEYALRTPASFWTNLQGNYDIELTSFNEENNITPAEIAFAKTISKPVQDILQNQMVIDSSSSGVISLRQLLGISNLLDIPKLQTTNFRVKQPVTIDNTITYVWRYICERETEDQTDVALDVNKLKDNLAKIKNVMLEAPHFHISSIQSILNECGIRFTVKKHVKGASINGLTTKVSKDQVLIALSIKGKYIDIFWFTLFHEIAHVIYGDYHKTAVDYMYSKEIEQRADKFAQNMLIDQEKYRQFISLGHYSMTDITSFAKANSILPAVVLGRLMNDQIIDWSSGYLREQYVLNELSD